MRYRWLPIVSAVFLVIAMAIQFFVSYSWEKKRVWEQLDYEIQLAQKDFIFEVYDIQDAGDDMQNYVRRHLDDPDRLMHEAYVTLKRYPDIMACYVSFLPGQFDDDYYWYCPCAWRKGDSIVQELYGDARHDYFLTKWFKGAIESDDNGYWSPSYKDEDFSDLICTHSVRVLKHYDNIEDEYEDEDSIVCVVGLDFSMKWMDQMLEEIKPFDDACCMLYSTDGTLMLTSDNMGDKTSMDENMIIRSSVLSPMEMRLTIGVPKSRVWNEVRNKSIITLIVLLIGIGIATLLIRRMMHDQDNLTRAETANRLMEQELQIASQIQQSILREGDRDKVKKPWPDLKLMAALYPMREVGGDLYDFYRKDDDLFFIIGDVSGKSVTAAMFMSAAVNLFRSAVRRLQSPKAIMEDMNAVLSDNNPRMMFVTTFIGRLHIPTGELLYCNAGHLPPLKVQKAKTDSEVVSLDPEPNIPVGYDSSFRFKEQGTMLGEGDILVLYTDGVTEARNVKREMLGMARWKKIVAENLKSLDRKDLVALSDAGEGFVANADPSDDITMMFIQKIGEVRPAKIRVENHIEKWPALKSTLHNYCLCAGLDMRALRKLDLAVEEAAINIIHYSHAEWIEMEVQRTKTAALQDKGTKTDIQECITIILRDNGIAFNPTEQKETDIEKAMEERQIGGLGIALVRQIADRLEYHRNDNINELILTKSI